MCNQHGFVFEVDVAIRRQVIEKLEASPEHPLTPDVAPAVTGAYALYWKGAFVYGGKALDVTLRRRLGEHHKKISGRRGIDVKDVTCRFLIIESVWFVRAAEDAIIEHYKGAWQNSGFGAHIPGRGRPGIKPSKWDQTFPPK